MSSTDVGSAGSTIAEVSTIDMGLEVVTGPVSDVERAKRFYQSLGWREDVDLVLSEDIRLVQMTPPHSPCSIHFGKGVPGIDAMEPGSLQRVYLAVKDIDAAREDLLSRGVEVSEVDEQPKPPGSPTCSGARTSRTRHSATRTATAGCSRRSRPGCRGANGTTDMRPHRPQGAKPRMSIREGCWPPWRR